MNIIDELKKNKCPFSLMSPPLQTKAHDIGRQGNFQYWNGQVWITLTDKGDFKLELAYRLRADYTEEPEIEERLIMPAEAGLVCCSSVVGTENLLLSECVNHPDFIGFKFKDGTVAALPIRYPILRTSPRGLCASFDEIKASQDFMHATHVLFRRSK